MKIKAMPSCSVNLSEGVSFRTTGGTPATFPRASANFVIVHQAEEGGYWAEVPALPRCITEGDTMEELESNLKDAINEWLEVANDSHAAVICRCCC